MTEIADSLQVHARAAEVWSAIADPARHAAWHPFVTTITGAHREGATRACDVVVGGKRGRTEERCLLRDEGREILWAIDRDTTGFSKMVSDWRAGFRLAVSADGETTTVCAISSFTPKPVVRPLLPLIRRRFHQTQAAILAALKRHVESQDTGAGRCR